MNATETRTPTDLVRLSAQHLQSNGSDTPRLDAELLVAHALGIRRLDLYLQFERPLADAEVDTVRELVRRRGRGEPIAYITGEKEFYGRPFRVSPEVLIPRPDTETMINLLKQWASSRRADFTVLDLGTGSGCLAITVAAELPGTRVTAVDVSAEALQQARANAELNNVAKRMNFVAGSWWGALPADAAFDVVLSNPPYITPEEMEVLPRDVKGFEPDLALRTDSQGLAAYTEILTGLDARPAPALLLFEVDYRRAAAIADLVRGHLPNHTVRVEKDLAGHERVVVAEA